MDLWYTYSVFRMWYWAKLVGTLLSPLPLRLSLLSRPNREQDLLSRLYTEESSQNFIGLWGDEATNVQCRSRSVYLLGMNRLYNILEGRQVVVSPKGPKCWTSVDSSSERCLIMTTRYWACQPSAIIQWDTQFWKTSWRAWGITLSWLVAWALRAPRETNHISVTWWIR